MAETQAQKEARWRAEGYVQSKGGAWVKPGTAAYDQAMALDASRAAEHEGIVARRTMAQEAARAYNTPTDIARMLAEGKRQGKSVVETIDSAPETKAASDAAKAGASAPADTYGAMLRELARARTQSQMRATNGRAGSILGVGTDSYTAPAPAGDTTNDRVSADKLHARRPVGSNRSDNYRVPAYARLSRLGLFSNVSRGMR